MRVVVTRPPEHAAALVAELERLGHDVAVCPLIRVEPLGDEPVDVAGYDWVVVTSANGARELLRRRRGELPSVAAIGPATATALRDGGVEPALVPETATQEGLLDELPPRPGRVLFAGAEAARPLLADSLDADVIPLYRTVERRPDGFPVADLVVLASASAARAYAALALSAPAVSIGPQTTAAAEAGGVVVVAEARTHDTAGLVAAVRELPSI